jgi:hypothetical protein
MGYPVIPTADDLAFFAEHKIDDKLIRRRIVMERMVTRRAIRDMISAGYQLRWFDGGEWMSPRTNDIDALMLESHACDEQVLYVFRTKDDGKWLACGSIYFVYGNDGYDVIADYSISLEKSLKGANELADKLG